MRPRLLHEFDEQSNSCRTPLLGHEIKGKSTSRVVLLIVADATIFAHKGSMPGSSYLLEEIGGVACVLFAPKDTGQPGKHMRRGHERGDGKHCHERRTWRIVSRSVSPAHSHFPTRYPLPMMERSRLPGRLTNQYPVLMRASGDARYSTLVEM